MPQVKPVASSAGAGAGAGAKPTGPAVQTPPAPSAGPATPVNAPLFKVVPLTKISNEQRLNLLVYGKYGAGKTTFAGTAADVEKMRDVFVLSVEGGHMSMQNDVRIKNPRYIDVVEVRTFGELQTILDFLKAHIIFRNKGDVEKLKALQTRVMSAEHVAEFGIRKYQTVIIDSLTELDAACMAALLGINAGFSISSDMPVAEFKEYKQNFNKMQLLVRQFRDLDVHTIITAATAYEQDELKRYHFTLALTGKLSNVVQGFFDVVGNLQTGAATEDKEAPRRLYVQPVGGTFDAKSRLPKARKAFFDDPKMSDVLAAAGML